MFHSIPFITRVNNLCEIFWVFGQQWDGLVWKAKAGKEEEKKDEISCSDKSEEQKKQSQPRIRRASLIRLATILHLCLLPACLLASPARPDHFLYTNQASKEKRREQSKRQWAQFKLDPSSPAKKMRKIVSEERSVRGKAKKLASCNQ